MLHAHPTTKARTCNCYGSGVVSGHWFPPHYRCPDRQIHAELIVYQTLILFMFSNLFGSGYIIIILYCCPNFDNCICYYTFCIVACGCWTQSS